MLIENSEAEKRLNNPLNLINRMRDGLVVGERKANAMSLFTGFKGRVEGKEKEKVEVTFNKEISSFISSPSSLPQASHNPYPAGEEIINDSDAKIKLAIAHDGALGLLTGAIRKLNNKVENDEIKASSLPGVIASASKVVSEIRKERLEREKTNREGENVHYHFYCPTQRKMDEYEVIDVTG